MDVGVPCHRPGPSSDPAKSNGWTRRSTRSWPRRSRAPAPTARSRATPDAAALLQPDRQDARGFTARKCSAGRTAPGSPVSGLRRSSAPASPASRFCYKSLIRIGLMAANPCEAIERPKTVPSQLRGLSANEIRKLLASSRRRVRSAHCSPTRDMETAEIATASATQPPPAAARLRI